VTILVSKPVIQFGSRLPIWPLTSHLQKLASKHHSPFRIKDRLSDLMYRLKLPAHWKIHNVFHVNVLSEAQPDMIPNCTNPAPPPVKVNDEDFWVMERYMDAWWFCN
jgi:hypothetical protein